MSGIYGSTILLPLLEGAQINQYGALISFAILYYDYCLTFHTEVEEFWGEFNLSLVSVLFVVNRYLSLLGPAPILVEFFARPTEMRCRLLQSFHQYFAVFSQGIVAVLLTIRTYALYNKSRRVAGVLISAWLIAGCVSLWSVIGNKDHTVNAQPSMVHGQTCDLSLTNEQARSLAGAWSCMLGFDTLVFFLTVVKAARSNLHHSSSLFHVMLRDEVIYYGLITLMNIGNVMTLLVVVPSAKGLFTTTTNVVSSILVTRLILNLRIQAGRTKPFELPS